MLAQVTNPPDTLKLGVERRKQDIPSRNNGKFWKRAKHQQNMLLHLLFALALFQCTPGHDVLLYFIVNCQAPDK